MNLIIKILIMELLNSDILGYIMDFLDYRTSSFVIVFHRLLYNSDINKNIMIKNIRKKDMIAFNINKYLYYKQSRIANISFSVKMLNRDERYSKYPNDFETYFKYRYQHLYKIFIKNYLFNIK